jgi:predicted nucleic acid-binding protein
MVIIGLAKGGVFNYLQSIYSPLYISPSVREEVVAHGQGRVGASELTQALGSWITQIVPDPAIMQTLTDLRSLADREVLAIAADPMRAIDHLLTDDGQLRGRASRPGLACLRTPEVVVLLKARQLIPEARSVLDRMRQQGFGIDDALYAMTLRAAGE